MKSWLQYAGYLFFEKISANLWDECQGHSKRKSRSNFQTIRQF